MTLATYIVDPESTAFLKPYIHSPRIRPTRPIVVPSAGEYPNRLGTAFDCALRHGLSGRGWGVGGRELAEAAFPLLASGSMTGRITSSIEEIPAILDEARSAIDGIGAAVTLSERAAKGCLTFASLDAFVLHPSDIGPPTLLEIGQLQHLFAIIPWEAFRPRERLRLSQPLGFGSDAGGGAITDLVVDECLMELKTLKTPAVSLATVRQLVAYALLANAFGWDGKPLESLIVDLAVYHARSGEISRFSLDTVIAPSDHRVVLNYILGRGRREKASMDPPSAGQGTTTSVS